MNTSSDTCLTILKSFINDLSKQINLNISEKSKIIIIIDEFDEYSLDNLDAELAELAKSYRLIFTCKKQIKKELNWHIFQLQEFNKEYSKLFIENFFKKYNKVSI